MTIYRVDDLGELASIGASGFANRIARKKSKVLLFKIEDLSLPATQILKQEALSAGGDFIVPKEAILARDSTYRGILIATESQLDKIIAKCAIQPFGLKKMGVILRSHTHTRHFVPKIMGIINITEDSFWAESRVVETDKILQKVREWIDWGVEIIDIGGASSRPDSEYVESGVEIARLKDALNALDSAGLTKKARFSIDSYNSETIEFALNRGFRVINDVYSLKDSRIIDIASDFGAEIILMHNSWIYPHTRENIIVELEEFFARKLEILEARNLKNIMLDIGFGFGKNDSENLALVRNLKHFAHFGYEILVGASRKRSIGAITGAEVSERLFGTLALHQIALQNGASIIRCHDVRAHIDMVKVFNALCGENPSDNLGEDSSDLADSGAGDSKDSKDSRNLQDSSDLSECDNAK